MKIHENVHYNKMKWEKIIAMPIHISMHGTNHIDSFIHPEIINQSWFYIENENQFLRPKKKLLKSNMP